MLAVNKYYKEFYLKIYAFNHSPAKYFFPFQSLNHPKYSAFDNHSLKNNLFDCFFSPSKKPFTSPVKVFFACLKSELEYYIFFRAIASLF